MRSRRAFLKAAAAMGALAPVAGVVPASSREPVLVPALAGDWWLIASKPDLGTLGTPRQQPVDFAIWQAADGTWQLCSCIRGTKEPGKTRLLHRWEGQRLTDRDWKPMGVAMQADPALGETLGGLQAPFVVRAGALYHMFYGDWQNICRATSRDGKTFERQPLRGISGLFGDGPQVNTRDPMVIEIDGVWHAYYTASPRRVGGVYCRTSRDLSQWSEPTLVARGGQAGHFFTSMECPHVVKANGWYYLLTTQRYRGPQTLVHRSRDPLYFGIEDDRGWVARLPVAAPEVVEHDGRHYLAALEPELDGIRVTRLEWVEE